MALGKIKADIIIASIYKELSKYKSLFTELSMGHVAHSADKGAEPL